MLPSSFAFLSDTNTNWHFVILIWLAFFSAGHGFTRSRSIGWATVFGLTFGVSYYIQFKDSYGLPVAITGLLCGIIYAERYRFADTWQEITYFFAGVGRFIHRKKAEKEYRKEQEKQQANYEQEQARRQEEARAYRQQQQQQEEQQRRSHERQQQREQKEREQRNYQRRRREQQEQQQQQKPTEYKDTRTPMEILGLQPGFTQEELKKARKTESARFHPDKIKHKPEHLRKAMEEEQKRINWAYDQLSKK